MVSGRRSAIGDREYGYDIVCPAVYADGSLAIAGYYGTGFCRVDLDGPIRWRTDLADADFLPSVNEAQVAAVGSGNDQVSVFFAADGSPIGRYARPALFASHGTDWVALAKDRVANVTTAGDELWLHQLSSHSAHALPGVWVQPIVDPAGYVYVRHGDSLFCCTGEGELVFDMVLPTGTASPVSVIAPGVLALIAGDELLIGAA